MGTSRLKVYMAEKDIRAKELCYMAKVSQDTISRLMNGRSKPTIDVAYRISRALGVKVNKLFENV